MQTVSVLPQNPTTFYLFRKEGKRPKTVSYADRVYIFRSSDIFVVLARAAISREEEKRK